MDDNGDGLISAVERQYALDHFEPGKEADHATARAHLTAAETQLQNARREAAHTASVLHGFRTTSTVAAITGAVASLGMFLSTAIPALAAIPVVNIVFMVLAAIAGLVALIAKICEAIYDGKNTAAQNAVTAAQRAHDTAWQELAATLPRRREPAATPVPAPNPAPSPPSPIARAGVRTGVSLRRVA